MKNLLILLFAMNSQLLFAAESIELPAVHIPAITVDGATVSQVWFSTICQYQLSFWERFNAGMDTYRDCSSSLRESGQKYTANADGSFDIPSQLMNVDVVSGRKNVFCLSVRIKGVNQFRINEPMKFCNRIPDVKVFGYELTASPSHSLDYYTSVMSAGLSFTSSNGN